MYNQGHLINNSSQFQLKLKPIKQGRNQRQQQQQEEQKQKQQKNFQNKEKQLSKQNNVLKNGQNKGKGKGQGQFILKDQNKNNNKDHNKDQNKMKNKNPQQLQQRQQQAPYQEPQQHGQTKYKSFWIIFAICANLGLSGFYFGYTIAYFSSVQYIKVKQYYKLSFLDDSVATGLIIGMPLIGGFIGSLLATPVIKYLSRKNGVLFINIISIIAGIQIMVSHPVMLFGCRIVQGITVGIGSALIPLYVKQISPMHLAGTMGSIYQFQLSFGIFFAFFISYLLQLNQNLKQIYWKIMFLLSLITLTIQTLIIIFKYNMDPPRYLIFEQKIQQAKRVIQFIYKQQYVDEILQRNKIEVSKMNQKQQHDREQSMASIMDQIRFDVDYTQSSFQLSENVQDVKIQTQEQFKTYNQDNIQNHKHNEKNKNINQNKNQIRSQSKFQRDHKKIRKGSHQKRLINYNDQVDRQQNYKKQRLKKLREQRNKPLQNKQSKLFVFLSIFLGASQMLTGMNPINAYIYYYTSIAVGDSSQILNFVLTAQCFFSNIFTTWLLQCMGRKNALLMGFGTIIIAQLFLTIGLWTLQPCPVGQICDTDFLPASIFNSIFILIGLFVFNGIFGLTIGPIIWLYVPQFTQPHILPYASLANWSVSTILSTVFPMIRDALPQKNAGPFILILIIFNIICFIIIKVIAIQTKGKTYAEIKKQIDQFQFFKPRGKVYEESIKNTEEQK